MSSSDLNSDKSIDSKAIDDKEDLDALADSIDASLDAILSEAKEAQPAAEPEAAPGVSETAPAAEPPPAEVQMAVGENGAGSSGLTDEMETPLPVILDDEEPSYKAFADMVASPEAPKSEPAPEPQGAEISAESAEPESGEILDADELIDSMTPSPVLAEEAEAAVARTEESAAYAEPPPPPSDEEILDHVKLPPGSTPMPMPLVASPAADEAPGASLEDDQTVISPMPPMPEPSVSLPPPRRMTSAWAAVPPEPSILLASEGLGTKLGKMVKAPVQTSIATLAGVVLVASALGGGVVRLLSNPATPATVTVAAPAQAETPAPAPAIIPAPAAEKVAAVEAPAPAVAVADKPAPVAKAAAKPAAKPVAKPAAAQGTHIALAGSTPPKPAPAKKAAPAAKPKKAPASSAGWVDPFGQ